MAAGGDTAAPGRHHATRTSLRCSHKVPLLQVHAELQLEVPVDHGLLVENLLDLAHAPFTHTTTFAKGWPVPDVVKFQAQQLLAGHWEPYPIDMSFEPPCMVLSTIGALRAASQLASYAVQTASACTACAKHTWTAYKAAVPMKSLLAQSAYRMACAPQRHVLHVRPETADQAVAAELRQGRACRSGTAGEDHAWRQGSALREPSAPAARVPACGAGAHAAAVPHVHGLPGLDAPRAPHPALLVPDRWPGARLAQS